MGGRKEALDKVNNMVIVKQCYNDAIQGLLRVASRLNKVSEYSDAEIAIWATQATPPAAVMVPAPHQLKHWRRFSPRMPPQADDHITMHAMEKQLKSLWVARLLALLAPYAREFTVMAEHLGKEEQDQEWRDLFGQASWQAMRSHTHKLFDVSAH